MSRTHDSASMQQPLDAGMQQPLVGCGEAGLPQRGRRIWHALRASMPMYALPELRAETDGWWRAIARALRARGLSRVPGGLFRTERLLSHWRSSQLLWSQVCGYRLWYFLRDTLRVVATPRYDAPGCRGSDSCSLVVVRRNGPRTLDDLEGLRLAVNDSRSHTGMNALRALIAQRAGGGALFSRVIISGNHRASMELIASGKADVAAIDAVTFALTADVRPDLARSLRVIAETDACPSLPYVTAAVGADERMAHLRDALFEVLEDPALAGVRRRLRIVDADVRPVTDYAPIAEAMDRAASHGYVELR